MTQDSITIERVEGYLRQLTPQARSRLLNEIERLQFCGEDVPGSEKILANLRAEFRRNGTPQDRVGNASRYFFQPLEPFLIDRLPEHANSGQISRGSLSAIWDWINLNLLPTMARDYAELIRKAISTNNEQDAQKIAKAFQIKIAKYLEATFKTDDGRERTRAALALYTSSPASIDDLSKMLCVLRSRDALSKFGAALPPAINKFAGGTIVKIARMVDALAAKHAEALPFALTLVARRLKVPWHLMFLALKTGAGRENGKPGSAFPLAVSMVVDQLDDKRLMLTFALRARRIVVAKEVLAEIDQIEQALRKHADLLIASGCGGRLDEVMTTVDGIVESEVQSIPGEVEHVLASRKRRRGSVTRRITTLLGKGRDALSVGAANAKGLLSNS
jgi:hypothetical protein